MYGNKNYNWKGGTTLKHEQARKSIEYKIWRTKVFIRDKKTCLLCGYQGNNINADHIKPFSLFPELRYTLSNGRTLCVPCHKKTKSYLNHKMKKEEFINVMA